MLSRRTLIGIALLSFTADIASAQELPKHITIAVEGAYPPWNLTTADGKLAGYEVDVVKTVCERIKVECSLVPQEWNGMIPGLNAGKFDTISGMGVTEERKKVVSFTKPYARTPNGFVVAVDGPLVDLPNAGETFNLTRAPQKSRHRHR
ncbi:transporter substrate-binding domain-containing protein [Rhizobium rhizogenes]|uniref:transporter substrate-binding domain-containing protein n=1 Tax=Rhizobium rhizogenes TaxID=359 RepID=UPI0019202500|nr:transporter substrate-binding domain-containing protein [Rhizobium rhizogenes]